MFGKFAYLRGNFQRILRKIRNTPSGSGGKPEPKWEYFHACSFLLAVYDNTSFESSLELPRQEEVVCPGPLQDFLQEEYSALHSPKSTGVVSPAALSEITISPIDASLESHTPSPQAFIDTPSPQDATTTPAPQEVSNTTSLQDVPHTPSPQYIIHTPSPQYIVHTPSHQSAGLGNSTKAAAVTPRGGHKRKFVDSGDNSVKIVEALSSVQDTVSTYFQNKNVNKPGQYDIAQTCVESFLKSFPLSKRLKMEFCSKIVSVVHEYVDKYNDETHEDVWIVDK